VIYSQNGNKTAKSIIYLAPALGLLIFFFVWPIILTFYYSFTNLSLTGQNAVNFKFTGFQNFVNMFSDPLFKTSFFNTLIFLVFSAVIGQAVLGFCIAFLMKEKNIVFRRFVGISVLIGWIVPELICSFCWIAFLSERGSLNAVIQLFMDMKPIAFLYSFPMICVIIANIWHGTAYSMLQFQAALDNISGEVEEAASIDGATGIQKVTRIIIPMIKNTIVTNMILVTLQTLGVFGLIYAMTGGGPGTKTTTLSIYMYKQAFLNYQMGYGTAISLVLLLIGIILSILYLKFSKIKV